jgi:hypothetical protein
LQHSCILQNSSTFVCHKILQGEFLLKNQIIRKSSALFLLVLISLATTPKLLLHNIFANHNDASFQLSKDGHAKLANAVINCHTQDLVVEAPFISYSSDEQSSLITSFKLSYKETVTVLLSLTDFYFELRGPPVFA